MRTYPLTLLLVTAIWVVCLIDIPETPLDHVTLIDKWVHIAMYTVLAMTVGHEYFHGHKRSWTIRGMMVRAWLMPALMGGLVEIVQATCTGGRRSGDWLDFAANAIGATVGWTICTLLARWLSRR